MLERQSIEQSHILRLEKQRDKLLERSIKCGELLQAILEDNYNLKNGYPIRPELRDDIEQLLRQWQ